MDTLKLENISVKGSATVELKNSRGKTIEKVEGNNFISSVVLNQSLRAMQRSFFSIPFNNQDFYTRSLPNFFPTHMTYTNSAVAENPLTEVSVTGNVIGFSSLDGHTSADTRRGIINTTESSHNINRTRIVCDWPTDRGNGICRSIYFTLSSESLPIFPPPMHTLNATLHTINNRTSQPFFITSNNVDLFLGDHALHPQIHHLRNNLIISNTAPSPTGFRGSPNWFTVIGNNVYSLSSRNLLVTPVGGTTSTVLTSNFGNGDETLLAIGNIIHIFPESRVPHQSFTVERFDVGTMQRLSALTPILTIPWLATRTSFPLSNTVIRVGGASGNYADLNLTTLQISDTGIQTGGMSVTLHQGNFVMLNSLARVPTFYTSPNMNNNSNMFSRLLLPADINKTSANTLKITYDFVYS